MNKEEAIEEIYSHGWSRKFVRIEPIEDGIKVRGGLTGIDWRSIKFEFYDIGWMYDKEKRIFVEMV